MGVKAERVTIPEHGATACVNLITLIVSNLRHPKTVQYIERYDRGTGRGTRVVLVGAANPPRYRVNI